MRPYLRITLLWLLSISATNAQQQAQQQTKQQALPAPTQTKILWDTFGVPHIFAPDYPALFHAHGYAQMQNHGNLLLRLYGESRGRAAEYWGGPANLELDRWLAVNQVRDRAELWYRQQDPAFRTFLDAFAQGINDFAAAHPEAIAEQYRIVLPVTGVDVIGHSLRTVHYMYMGSSEAMHNAVDPLLKQSAHASSLPPAVPSESIPGSNTWSVAAPLSASGHPMLLINPHLLWGDTFYKFMEVHLVAPGMDLIGAPQVGFPVPVVGFNPDAGWGRTVDRIDTVDFYRLTVPEGQTDSYLFDGRLVPFEHATRTLRIKQSGTTGGGKATYTEEVVPIRRSVHGPVVFDRQGVTIAMRVAALDRPKMLEQWFRMGLARNVEDFQNALRMQSVPLWTADYAGADGHILLVYNGVIPRRKTGDWKFWSGVVPGDTSETLWTSYLSFEELPRSLDPPSGFNQNTNDQPWLMTLPMLSPAAYPRYISPGPEFLSSFRSLQSLRLLTQRSKITFDQFLLDKHTTRVELAVASVPDLVQAASATTDPTLLEAARVLKAWDLHVDPASRGAVLFQRFAEAFFFTGPVPFEERFRIPYDFHKPLDGPSGLADPAAALAVLKSAAEDTKRLYGTLDVPWGDVFRFRLGGVDLPANGATDRMGVIRSVAYQPAGDGRYVAFYGETIVCAIEFIRPQRAQCLLGYGNASQPGSTHIADQLPLFAAKKLSPVWRTQAEIEKHLERKELLPFSFPIH